MSRDLPPVDNDPAPPPTEGRIRPTGPGPLMVVGLVGLVVGWAIRGQAIRSGAPVPGVSWLVLGKAVARLGAFGLGAYVGIAISNLGVDGEHTSTTILRASLAALGAAAALTTGLLLEHACRIPPQDR